MLKPEITVKIDTTRLKALQKQFKDAEHAYVAVGVHDEAGSYPDGPTVVQVALWNEFGTVNIPSRPFIRKALYDKATQINSWRAEGIRKVIAGEFTIKQALEMIGFRLREAIKNNITSDMPPPNSPETKARKIREGVAPRTLVETGLLLRSIEYKVVGL